MIFGIDNDNFRPERTEVSVALDLELSDARLFDRLLRFVGLGLKARGGSRGRPWKKDGFAFPDLFVSPLVLL